MSFARFVYKNSLRNKRRTFLTILSIAFSLLVLITLQTTLSYLFDPPLTDEADLRLAVKRSTSFADSMPLSYWQKLEKVPHVELVTPFHWFGGYYKEQKNFFANFAVDHNSIWGMFPDLGIDAEAREAFVGRRDSAVVGEELMGTYQWKVGDRITLKGTIYPVDLDMLIVGTYRSKYRSSSLFFRYDYFSESVGNPGIVSNFWLKADAPGSVSTIMETVDTMFRNTPAETKTETEKSFVLSFMSMLGNVQMFVGSIALVIVFTMLLITASTMAMTIRERLREVAILKALGYTRSVLLVLILGEAAFISLVGAGVACVFGYSLTHVNFYILTKGLIENFNVSPQTYAMAIGTGIGIGVLSGIVPAWQASRMTITEAIRRLA